MDKALHEEFEAFCKAHGMSKVGATEQAIRQYMDKMNKASASVTVKGTSAELKNLKAGTLYKAVISPYKEIKDASGKVVRVYDGAKASMFNLNTQAPSLKAANSNLAITISWDRIAGAGSYDVYRSLKGKNSFSKVKSVTGTSYKDSNLKDNTAYDYKVQVMGSAYKGASSGVISRTALANPGKPSNLKANRRFTTSSPRISASIVFAIGMKA